MTKLLTVAASAALLAVCALAIASWRHTRPRPPLFLPKIDVNPAADRIWYEYTDNRPFSRSY